MIEVRVVRNPANQICSFTISGHAEAGPYGYDLVCAAVSALSLGTVNAVETLCGVELPAEMGGAGGFLRCDVPDDLETGTDEKVQLLLEGMLVSLHSIAEEYREHITIY